MTPLQCSGLWWKADDPSDKVAGTLTFSDEKGVSLSLTGTLGEEEFLPADPKRVELVHGVCENSPYGDGEVTLLQCDRSGYSIGSPGYGRESYFVQRAYFGGHIGSPDGFKFARCELHLSGLHAWANRVIPIEVEFKNKQDPWLPLQATYDRSPDLSITVPGCRVELIHGASWKHDVSSFTIKQTACFYLSAESPLTDDEWQRSYVGALHDFLTFAANTPTRMEKVLFTDELGGEYQLIRPRIFSDDVNEDLFYPHLMLFSLEEIAGRLQDVIRLWFEARDKHREAMRAYFNSLYGKQSYLESRLLPLCIALDLYQLARGGAERAARIMEAVHRVFGAGEVGGGMRVGGGSTILPQPEWLEDLELDTFRHGVAGLLEEHAQVADPLLPQGREEFLREAAGLRKYALTRKGTPPLDSYGQRLYVLVGVLGTVMKASLLKEIGVDEETRVKVLRRNQRYMQLGELAHRTYDSAKGHD